MTEEVAVAISSSYTSNVSEALCQPEIQCSTSASKGKQQPGFCPLITT